MKVLLKEDVETLGYAGEVHEVAPGYGRNFLIPRGLAQRATPGVMKAAKSWRIRAEARRAQIRKEHEALVERINATTLNFTAKAGEQGKLYGSITSASIADDLNEALGIDLDRRKIDSPPLRQIGEHQVAVILSREHRGYVKVFVHPEGEDETPKAEEPSIAEVETTPDVETDQEYDWEYDWQEDVAEEG